MDRYFERRIVHMESAAAEHGTIRLGSSTAEEDAIREKCLRPEFAQALAPQVLALLPEGQARGFLALDEKTEERFCTQLYNLAEREVQAIDRKTTFEEAFNGNRELSYNLSSHLNAARPLIELDDGRVRDTVGNLDNQRTVIIDHPPGAQILLDRIKTTSFFNEVANKEQVFQERKGLSNEFTVNILYSLDGFPVSAISPISDLQKLYQNMPPRHVHAVEHRVLNPLGLDPMTLKVVYVVGLAQGWIDADNDQAVYHERSEDAFAGDASLDRTYAQGINKDEWWRKLCEPVESDAREKGQIFMRIEQRFDHLLRTAQRDAVIGRLAKECVDLLTGHRSLPGLHFDDRMERENFFRTHLMTWLTRRGADQAFYIELSRLRGMLPTVPEPAVPPPPAIRTDGRFVELEQELAGLKGLMDRGLITPEEYETKRHELLSRL